MEEIKETVKTPPLTLKDGDKVSLRLTAFVNGKYASSTTVNRVVGKKEAVGTQVDEPIDLYKEARPMPPFPWIGCGLNNDRPTEEINSPYLTDAIRTELQATELYINFMRYAWNCEQKYDGNINKCTKAYTFNFNGRYDKLGIVTVSKIGKKFPTFSKCPLFRNKEDILTFVRTYKDKFHVLKQKN